MSLTAKIFVVMMGLAGCAASASAQVAVIAHKDVPTDAIDQDKLLDFYTGDTQSWDGRLRVIVFDLKTKGDVKEAFYDYLGKSSSRMKSIWLKRKLAGEGDPPESFQSEDEMLRHVVSTPGAIGFVRLSKASGRSDVKILQQIDLDEG